MNAIKKIAISVKQSKIGEIDEIDEKLIESNLYTAHLPQNRNRHLILRTSGEKRLSGFFIMAIVIAKLFFAEILVKFRKIYLMTGHKRIQPKYSEDMENGKRKEKS